MYSDAVNEAIKDPNFQELLGSVGFINFSDFSVQIERLGSEISLNAIAPYYYSLNKGDNQNDFLRLQMGRLKQELDGLDVKFEVPDAFVAMDGTYNIKNNEDQIENSTQLKAFYDKQNENKWSWWTNGIWNGTTNRQIYIYLKDTNVKAYSNVAPWNNNASKYAPKTWGWVNTKNQAVIQVTPGNDGDFGNSWGVNVGKKYPLFEGSVAWAPKVGTLLENGGVAVNLYSDDYFYVRIKFTQNTPWYDRVKAKISKSNNGTKAWFYYIKNTNQILKPVKR